MELSGVGRRICSITNMNQFIRIDSNKSLDAKRPRRDPATMTTQPYQIYIERTDAARKMARFYTMALSTTLFGEACLTRRWGRIGASGQLKTHRFAEEEEAVRLFLRILRRKRARGYRPKFPFSAQP